MKLKTINYYNMKKITILIAAFAAASFFQLNVYAQNGGITAEMMTEIQKGYAATPADKAIKNALNTTPISTLAANSENMVMIDTHFSDKVKIKGITNQLSSGRCWLFSGLNVLRARMIDKYDLGDFSFSQNYVFFFDQLEKANLFLQGVIDTRKQAFDDREVTWLFGNPIGDGGTFTGVCDLVTKYGLVPADAMPETYCSNNTSQMSGRLKSLLRKDGVLLREAYEASGPASLKGNKAKKAEDEVSSKLGEMKVKMLSEVYHILAISLGVPPTQFVWDRYNSKGDFVSSKTYSPKDFFAEFVGADMENGYVMFMNDPSREYGKVYEIEYDRHIYDGHNWRYLNLPIDRIKEMAIASIKDNTAMYFSCDVAKFMNRPKGVLDLKNFDYNSLMGVNFDMSKKERILSHDSGSSHAMSLMAVDIKKGAPVKWMVENSWGSSGYQGCMIMTDEWFNEYMFRLVVEKKYVPADIMKMLDQKSVMLPPWDPMFLPEE